jgi:hypothetical protein
VTVVAQEAEAKMDHVPRVFAPPDVSARRSSQRRGPGPARRPSPLDAGGGGGGDDLLRFVGGDAWCRSVSDFPTGRIQLRHPDEREPDDDRVGPAISSSPRVQRSSVRLPGLTPTASRVQRSGRDRLPPDLVAGIGSLSGLGIDDVRVHYASGEPARMGALAYTRGRDIYVGPGQEAHLAHEAWHVVQQAQGRVRATTHVHDGSAANDDGRLEREADVMGSRASREPGGRRPLRPLATIPATGGGEAPVQMVREDEFKRNPQGFLAGNVLSLTTFSGLVARSASPDLVNMYQQFINSMGRFDKHWFKLVPDAGRTTPDQAAYILTPALEKYLQAYPADPLLAPVATAIQAALPIGADADYLDAGYVEYKNIGADNTDETTIGHSEVTRSRDTDTDFNPDLIFTAAMNGCAFTVTPSEDADKFVAWHFQSSSSNRTAAAAFRQQRAPFDWFGEDEYDSNAHAGMFEVTNFLHRGADDQWSVISQQNETPATQAANVEIQAVTSRRLELDQRDPDAIARRVYAAMQRTNAKEIRDSANNLYKYEKHLPFEFGVVMRRLVFDVHYLLNAEADALRGPNPGHSLFAVAVGLRDMRQQNLPKLQAAVTALVQWLDKRDRQEKERWEYWQDKDLIKDLGYLEVNLNNIPRFYGLMEWIDLLVQESSPV